MLPLATIGAYVLSACTITLFRPFLAARTDLGRESLNEAKGLTLFMSTATKELESMKDSPDKAQELFVRLLPYALSLGVTETWAEHFFHIIKEANTPESETAYNTLLPSYDYILRQIVSDDMCLYDFSSAVKEFTGTSPSLDMSEIFIFENNSQCRCKSVKNTAAKDFSGNKFPGGGGIELCAAFSPAPLLKYLRLFSLLLFCLCCYIFLSK